MRIKQAKTAGFCFGVDRAVNLAYETAEKGVKACSLGPLIHNDTVTDSLREKGIDVPANLYTVRQAYDALQRCLKGGSSHAQ